MKPETKLKLRKWAISALRAVIWHADEWLHRREVKLREEIERSARRPDYLAPQLVRRESDALRADTKHSPVRGCDGSVASHNGRRAERSKVTETFPQWEARRSGIAIVSKKDARRRRQTSSSAFDLRFAR